MPVVDGNKVDFQVTVKGHLGAGGGQQQQTVNVLHYLRTSFATAFVATDFVTAFQAAIQAAWLAATSIKWNWDSTGIRCINGPDEAEVDVVINTPGGVAGDCEPGHVTMIIGKKTPLRGRKYQGRLFIAGVPESGNVDNALTNGHKVLLDNLATALLGTITTGAGVAFVPTILSASSSNLIADPSIVVATPINQFYARQIVGRMDSRASRPLS